MMFRRDTSGRRPLPANDRFPKTKQRQRKLVRIPRERFPWKSVENYRILSHGGKRVAGKRPRDSLEGDLDTWPVIGHLEEHSAADWLGQI